jgi:citrate synthase
MEILKWSSYLVCAYSYGHGVLRKPDPRFIALQQFSASRAELKDSPIIKLVNKTSEVAPGVLTEHGKVSVAPPYIYAFHLLTL